MSEAEYHAHPSPSRPETVQTEPVEEETPGQRRRRNYTIEHFTAVIKPVALTMALAALVVTQVRTVEFTASLSTGLSIYTVYGANPTANAGTQLWQAVINALVIVGGVLCMTFVMVCLYYFRLIKLLYGLLIFTTVMSLSYTLGIIIYIATIEYNLTIDVVSLLFFLFNFSVGGVVSIFWGKAPIRIVQGYLVCVSVIISYLLSFFPEWTSWALMVALSFYDMYAVLTPYGPLKCLVEMAIDKGDPIPGLIYEAKLVRLESTDGSDAPMAIPPSAPAPTEVKIDIERDVESPKRVSDRLIVVSGEHKESDNQSRLSGVVMPLSMEPSENQSRTSFNARSPPPENNGPSGDAKEMTAEEEEEDDAVKLGLGDFIFYSMLVSKAALYGFATFSACYFVVLFGLITTMLLLAILARPLPALPVSMLLGVALYFSYRGAVVPMLGLMVTQGYSF